MIINRGHFFTLAITLLLACRASAQTSPNILYIFTDDQSYRSVSCYPRSYDLANTPNIDSLADNGIRFDQAYIGAKCVPSRAMALTGRLQFAVNSNYDGSEITGVSSNRAAAYWMPTLRAEGYYTGMIGKWHWGGGAAAHDHGNSWDWSVVWDHGAYKPYDSYYNDQYVMINGSPDQLLGGYSTDRYTDYTVQFINERAQEPNTPWFMWLCYAGVHSPYTPADRHLGTLDSEPEPEIPVDIYGPRPGKPVHFQDTKWTMGGDGKPYHKNKTLEFWVKQQLEAVASIDEGVGRIVQALDDTGQLDNTIIIFTADQGYVWGEHGLKGKIDPYESAIRAPFIVSNPTRFPTGKVCKAPINGPDVIRTFHAWADATPSLFMPGRDITPLLQNPESETVLDDWSNIPTMMTYVHNRYEPLEMRTRLQNEDWGACMYGTDTPWYFFIIVKNYKYTRYANPDRIEELYDLENDPEELVNLALLPQYKYKVLEMRAACDQSLIDNGGGVFVEYLPTPTTANYWPDGEYASDNATVLDGSGIIQDDSEELKTKNGWGSADSQLAYIRFNLSDTGELGGYAADALLSVSLELYMTQTEGDAANEIQVFALLDDAQDSPSDLTETSWTGSTGANPLVDTNLPQGDNDPQGSALTTTLLGSHTFAATGDDSELGLLAIPLSLSAIQTLIGNDSNQEITLIVRSTSTGQSNNFASFTSTNANWSGPTLSITAEPSAPTGLNSNAQDGRVLLNWDDSTEADFASYNIYRSTTPGDFSSGPLESGLTSSVYIDNSVTNGETYFYVVTVVNSSSNESNQSTEVSASPEAGQIPGETVLFGSSNEGFASFTQSTEATGMSWSLQADSVQMRCENTGTVNTSLLREFPLDRSVGATYTIEGVIELTDGYADDNNRVGLYLFGDSAEIPGEDEVGAIGLIFNTDDSSSAGYPGNNADDNLTLTNGINTPIPSGQVLRNQTIPYAQDLFGTTVALTATITFVDNAGTEEIVIVGTITDSGGISNTVTATVNAAAYTGDYFGFVTRARARYYTGSGGTPEGRSLPWVMNYKSFFVSGQEEPDAFQVWAEAYGMGIDADPDADSDGDGRSNVYEFGVGGNPIDANDRGVSPTFQKVGEAYLFTYPVLADNELLTYVVETTDDLMSDSWSPVGYELVGTNNTGGELDFVTVEVDQAVRETFIRLRIVR